MYWMEEQLGLLVAEDAMSPRLGQVYSARLLAEYAWSPNSSWKAGDFHLEWILQG